ncbi:MAG TPA: hypothetical protein VJB88_06110, partial [Vicinamibacteria bacterium]|nr:hypothetical protein [Vicinamibacteria bacterium]
MNRNLFILLALVSLPPGLFAQDNQEIATLEAFRGGVTVIRLGQSQPPSPSMPLHLNDILVT